MKTIIAAFCDQPSAQQALELLRTRGITDTRFLKHQDGDILRRLDDLNVPSDRAQLYAEASRRGAPVVIAHAHDKDATSIARELDQLGSLDLDSAQTRWRSEGWTGYDANAQAFDDDLCAREGALLRQESTLPAQAYAPESESMTTERLGAQATSAEDRDLDVIQERVQVGKREVERGGVRVRSFVVERPVHEEVELREERIDVHREPVDQPIGAGATDTTFAGGEEEFVVTATGEEAVVGKEARVVERVHVGKTAEKRTETIEETERMRDVEVEPIEGDRTRRH